MSTDIEREVRATRAKAIHANRCVDKPTSSLLFAGSMPVTPKMIHAIGWDVANRRAATAGRTIWNRADYNAACRETNRLMKLAGFAP